VPTAIGVGFVTQNIRDGIRWNASFAFLDDVRARVTVLAGLLADRFVVEGDLAQALIVRAADAESEIHAERFVLCAGVYGSPSILLRSGVGPPGHLRKLRIPIRVPLRGVGGNLHDHVGVGFNYVPTQRAWRRLGGDIRAGRFYQAQVMLKPDADFHVFPYQVQETSTRWSFGIFVFHLAPRSRGRMRLTTRDPRAAPAIQLALLTDRGGADRDALMRRLMLVHRLTRERPLQALIARGPRRFTDAARQASYVEDNITDYAHSVGTCRMGGTPDAGDV